MRAPENAAADPDVLRIVTCGSVDDGKSTLIGRIMHDAGLVAVDELARVERESRNRHVGPEGLDLSLLVDGLEAEREQGITIDVGYRYFATSRRYFIVADAPGHEQYTRNMVTGASTADLALILIDARKGVSRQTARHTLIAGVLGVRQAVLVVNKMDLIGWDAAAFERLRSDFSQLARRAGIETVTAVPVSALDGANVVRRGTSSPWYSGPALLPLLETAPARPFAVEGSFRFPVQRVTRPSPDFRGLAGTVARGSVRTGERLTLAPSGAAATVSRIVGGAGDLKLACAGDPVTLVLREALDVSRGDVLATGDAPQVADLLQACLIWVADEPMIPGRSYLMQLGTAQVAASVIGLKHQINPETFEHVSAKVLHANEIAVVDVAAERPIAFERYADDRTLGGFILIDRVTNATVGIGTIAFALRRASNLPWQNFEVTRQHRAALNGHPAAILWLTGLSGAGKTTIANVLERRLAAAGRHTYVLDGDNVRHGLNRDLGFSDAERVENVRRIAHVARLMADAGLIVIVAAISPFRRERALAREIAGDIAFVEIFVDAPLAVCEARDPKGLYRKARSGVLSNFTGVDSPYEHPDSPEIHLRSGEGDPEALAEAVLEHLRRSV
jgi:bifunctional enzyme CysN/CysC